MLRRPVFAAVILSVSFTTAALPVKPQRARNVVLRYSPDITSFAASFRKLQGIAKLSPAIEGAALAVFDQVYSEGSIMQNRVGVQQSSSPQDPSGFAVDPGEPKPSMFAKQQHGYLTVPKGRAIGGYMGVVENGTMGKGSNINLDGLHPATFRAGFGESWFIPTELTTPKGQIGTVVESWRGAGGVGRRGWLGAGWEPGGWAVSGGGVIPANVCYGL